MVVNTKRKKSEDNKDLTFISKVQKKNKIKIKLKLKLELKLKLKLKTDQMVLH